MAAINKDNIHADAVAQRVDGRLVTAQSRVARTGLDIFDHEHFRDPMRSDPCACFLAEPPEVRLVDLIAGLPKDLALDSK